MAVGCALKADATVETACRRDAGVSLLAAEQKVSAGAELGRNRQDQGLCVRSTTCETRLKQTKQGLCVQIRARKTGRNNMYLSRAKNRVHR